jgi:hypothetical protein
MWKKMIVSYSKIKPGIAKRELGKSQISGPKLEVHLKRTN